MTGSGGSDPKWMRAEEYVLELLVTRDRAFENHFVSSDGHGEFMPRMRSAIAGQSSRGHGADIFAVDHEDHLWIIEVSLGTPRGAARFKGGGRPVKGADYNLQMSEEWRAYAVDLFLNESDATQRIQALLNLPNHANRSAALARFTWMLDRHRKAIIVPAGTHFDTTGTDIDFLTEVYTHRFPTWFLSGAG